MFFDENRENGNEENIPIIQPQREKGFGSYPNLSMHTLCKIFSKYNHIIYAI